MNINSEENRNKFVPIKIQISHEPFELGSINFPSWLLDRLKNQSIIMERLPNSNGVGRWKIIENYILIGKDSDILYLHDGCICLVSKEIFNLHFCYN